MTNTFYSSCPEIRRTCETFVQHAVIGGARQRYEFAREIVWLRESTAELKLMHAGKQVVHVSTMNDYFGYLTSIKPESAMLATICERYAITGDTALELVVLASIIETPVFESPELAIFNRDKPANRKSQWANLPDDWRKEVLEEGEGMYSLRENVLATATVWSSRLDDVTNARMLGDFCGRWAFSASDGGAI